MQKPPLTTKKFWQITSMLLLLFNILVVTRITAKVEEYREVCPQLGESLMEQYRFSD